MASHGEHHHDARRESGGWKPHKDWRMWVAVLSMLAAIVAYVLTLDDSIIPR